MRPARRAFADEGEDLVRIDGHSQLAEPRRHAVDACAPLFPLGAAEVLEPHGLVVHVVAEDVDLRAIPRPADRAGSLEPLGRRDAGAAAFGATVRFVDDGTPPFDHGAFHIDRTWCRRVHDIAQRAEVVPFAFVLG